MINVHTIVVWNTIDYAYYMLQNARDMAANPSDLTFTIHCLDEHSYQYVSASQEFNELLVQVYPCIQPHAGQGSIQHGIAIDQAISKFSPDAHNAIFDGDTVMLQIGWDKTINKLMQRNHIAGINFTKMTGEHELFWYQNKPTVSWIVFKKGIDLTGFSALPEKDNHMVISDHDQSILYGISVGSTMIKDTGWQLPGFIEEKKLKAIGLPPSNSHSVFAPQDPFLEYECNDQPFVAHMQRSIKNGFKMTPTSRLFYEKCEQYIATLNS